MIAIAAPALLACSMGSALARQFDGFNVIVMPGHPFGSASARVSLMAAKRLGATTLAIIPFLWQNGPSSPNIQRGADMSDDELRSAIRQAHELGFVVVVKPQVWVPGSWAGAVESTSEEAWHSWFADYSREIKRIAKVAAEQHADIFSIGTELEKTTQRADWIALIAMVRAEFPGKVLYFAHDIEEAELVPFWPLLDLIGVTLYPPLGADGDRTGHLSTMRAIVSRLDVLSNRIGMPVLVGEIGLRSAVGAAARPWESTEERATHADPVLQADVLSDWLAVLERPSIDGVLIWRWFTDPSAGGITDTDFTVQGKPAENALICAWTADCKAH